MSEKKRRFAPVLIVVLLLGLGAGAFFTRDPWASALGLDARKALQLTLTSPLKGAVLESSPVLVAGKTEAGAKITINGAPLVVDDSGSFELKLEREEGAHEVVVRGLLAGRRPAEARRQFEVDFAKVKLAISSPKASAWVRSSAEVAGEVFPAAAVAAVTVNGLEASLTDGVFKAEVVLGGSSAKIIVEARDTEGRTVDRQSVDVHVDSEKPSLEGVENRKGDRVLLGEGRIFEGRILDEALRTLEIDGVAIPFDISGRFIHLVTKPGRIELVAIDEAGNRLEEELDLAFPVPEPVVLTPEAILTELSKWKIASRQQQDQAIELVGQSLGSAYDFVETADYTCHDLSYRIATFKHRRSGALLNLIPGGKYKMGFSGSRHPVTIREPLLIGKFEVTQAQWQTISGNDPGDIKGSGDLPVEQVSWSDIQAWLQKAGGGLRLPSEAEWEYACRAGSTTKFFWGEDMDSSYCWFQGNSGRKTHAVTEHSTKTNSFGLADMSGNVWEWCQDKYIEDYYGTPANELPRESARAYRRVIRGGCYGSPNRYLRPEYRDSRKRRRRATALGFRVARSID